MPVYTWALWDKDPGRNAGARSEPPYTKEFRRQMVDLVRAGRIPEELAKRNWPRNTDSRGSRSVTGSRNLNHQHPGRFATTLTMYLPCPPAFICAPCCLTHVGASGPRLLQSCLPKWECSTLGVATMVFGYGSAIGRVQAILDEDGQHVQSGLPTKHNGNRLGSGERPEPKWLDSSGPRVIYLFV